MSFESSFIPPTTSSPSNPTLGSGSRVRRLPARYRDQLPEPSPPTGTARVDNNLPPTPSVVRRVILYVSDSFRTAFNAFGIAREYRHRPSHDPDSFLTSDELSNVSTSDPNPSPDPMAGAQDSSERNPPPWPWKNMAVWCLMSWKLTGSSEKSDGELNRLVKVICSDNFKIEELKGFNAHTQTKFMNEAEVKPGMADIFKRDGWKTATVTIDIPTREKDPDGNGRPFSIENFRYRPLTAIIRAAFSEAAFQRFHLTPFKRIWKSPTTGKEQMIYDELYSSDAWIDEHNKVQKLRRSDGCQLERVIAGMMFWSDATCLAQFGHATAWPIYLFFGNISKYRRASSNTGPCHPVAFIPSVRLEVYSARYALINNLASAPRVDFTFYLQLLQN